MSHHDSSPIDLNRLLMQSLASWHDAGVTQLPRKSPLDMPPPPADAAAPSTASRVGSEPRAEALSSPQSAAAPPMPAAPVHAPLPSADQRSMPRIHEPMPPRAADPAAELRILAQEVSGCTRCAELASTRKQTVFGAGNPHARLVFFGEAPGADEDAQGEPFVGKAGKLLDKIIEACTLKRSDVFILNTLKCRPPGNRNPSPIESANCRPYFEKQLELIQPEFICCLGTVAAQNLLESTQTIGQLRGKFHDYRGIKVLCTYHPAYLLRNPSAKRPVWDDMQMLMKAMGIELPGG